MKIGLIGCGRAADLHMRVYKRITDAKVVAAADANPDRARIFTNRYKVGKTFTDYKDLLEIRDLDFVDVCTPTSTHTNIVCNAAKSGQNILVEKPMARSTAECERMIAESKRHGVKLCVCHNQRFYSSIRQAKSMVDEGYYDILSIRTSWKLKPHSVPQWIMTSQEGGHLWEWGYHLTYLQLYFLQSVNQVYAIGSKTDNDIYDNFTVFLRTPKNSYGIIEFSFNSKERERILEINSHNGNRAQMNIEFDYLSDMSADIKFTYEGSIRKMIGPSIHTIYLDVKRLFTKTKYRTLGYYREVSPSISVYIFPHFQLISSFINSLKTDSAPPVQAEEGRDTVRILECIEESLNKHQSVQVK